jgi:hypothetical protein
MGRAEPINRESRTAYGVAIALATLVSALCLLVGSTAASAAEAPPHWNIDSRAAPSTLPTEGEALLLVTLSNLGGPLNGAAEEVHVTDTLPEGVEVKAITPRSEGNLHSLERNLKFNEEGKEINPKGWDCTLSGTRQINCSYGQVLPSFEQLEIDVIVDTHLSPSSEPANEVRVTGGETPEAVLRRAIQVSPTSSQPPFGIEHFEMSTEELDTEGQLPAIVPDTQAGSHPFQLTSTFDLNQDYTNIQEFVGRSTLEATAPALQRNVSFNLPPGFIGDANVVGDEGAVQECSGTDFGALDPGEINGCAPNTAVGVAAVTFFDPITLLHHTSVVPVFNLVPSPGEPARLGLSAAHVPVVLDTAIRTGSDYGVTVTVHNASQAVQILGARVTIWGVPESPVHNVARGWACLGFTSAGSCETGHEVNKPTAYLTLPTACVAQPLATVTGESWPHHNEHGALETNQIGPSGNNENTTYRFPAFTGCEALEFTPDVSLEAEQHEGNTPTGLTLKVTVPQEGSLDPAKRAQSAVKDTTVEFPTGVMLNPANANGLEACGEGEPGIGFTGARELEPGYVANTFTAVAPECPEAAKVGSVTIRTPDLPDALQGGLYIAAQNANPFGSLFASYIVAQDPVSGVLVKLAGEVSVNPKTGRVTSTFLNTPDVPFEALTLHLFGGEGHGAGRSAFTTPPCGPVEPTRISFVSWSGQRVRDESAGFSVPECPGGRQPLVPSVRGWAANNQAGAYSPFELTIEDPDHSQRLTSVNVTLPPGLAAVLASVTPCPEPQAAQGTCGPESLIGHATAAVGLGNEPFVQKQGVVYLTGPYAGAPFGLSNVVPAKAGPFDFGKVVIRSTVSVDPNTAAVTVGSPLPTFVNTDKYQTGVPVQLKQLHVVTDRPNFQFNPTNCSPMPITASFTGDQGGQTIASSPFQVSNCASLPFAPKFSAAVAAQGSKASGTTFRVTVESGGLGVEGIRKAFFTVPKILPARLQPTLQNACPDSVFNINPGACPEDAFIGTATVTTPVLKQPLVGPAILVSHGNAAFPDVEFVLQSEGVHIVVDGKTDIKNGVTYSRFESTPDAPFTKFVTELPAGPHSIFTDNTEEAPSYNLCGKNIVAPTEITAQDGAVITQQTKVAVEGTCKMSPPALSKLAKALKACKKDKKRARRVACEKAARKKYGAKTSKKHRATKRSKKTR